MRQWLRSHLTYANVMVTILGFIVLGGTALAAAGGNFILGQSNSAGTPTQLSSATTNSAGALRVANTNTTTPGRGITAQGGAGGFGLWASGGNRSNGTAAIHGQSGAGNAIEGFSTANPASGVYGQDNNLNSYGVAGHSDNGVAVVGDSSSGWAVQALGNTTQTRGRSGFVKAMAYVKNDESGTDILQCFNSQVAASLATSGDCGISVVPDDPNIAGRVELDFGFKVDDRIFSVTPQSYGAYVANVSGFSNTTVTVRTRYQGNGGTDVPFYIIVY